MIIEYQPGQTKKPYDAIKINDFLKSLGVKAKKTRTGGSLIIETDKDLTPSQIEQLKAELDTYDLKNTKKEETVDDGKD